MSVLVDQYGGGYTESRQWPRWWCKNDCADARAGGGYPPDTKHVKCPHCGAQLVRWRNYQIRAERPDLQGKRR